MPEFRLATKRLVLRGWSDEDFAALHALCTDPLVMKTIGPLCDEERSRTMLAGLQVRQSRDGCTFWAMERIADGRVIGYCGIGLGTVPMIEDELEIGWRLASDCWGQSYAREAAEASLDWLWHERPGTTIWAITSKGNSRSRGLMERLGMRYCEDMDFDHPRILDGDPLLEHVTYRLDPPA